MLIVPLQVLARWLVRSGLRNLELDAVERIVGTAVVELISEAHPNPKPEVRCHGDVTLVEQAMEVGAEEKPVRNLVRTVKA